MSVQTDDATILKSLQADSLGTLLSICAVTRTYSQGGSKAGMCFLLFWRLGSPGSVLLAILLSVKSSCPGFQIAIFASYP